MASIFRTLKRRTIRAVKTMMTKLGCGEIRLRHIVSKKASAADETGASNQVNIALLTTTACDSDALRTTRQ
ncbi:unnamed protein product [Leptosia nina]|uniref:Uncharacterized protein n=1 Tax=Leptosia nina TaxID=320188 RepID=A0AAV1J9E8_9NEOP